MGPLPSSAFSSGLILGGRTSLPKSKDSAGSSAVLARPWLGPGAAPTVRAWGGPSAGPGGEQGIGNESLMHM